MKKTKRFMKAVRNWLIAILGTSLFMGLIFAMLISLPVLVFDLIQKKKIEFLKLIGFSTVFVGVSFAMIVAGVFFRLFEQTIDKDPIITKKLKKINQSDWKKAFTTFLDFFC